MGEKPRQDTQQTEKKGGKKGTTRGGGGRPPLDPDQCAYCKEYRHWKSECPKLKEAKKSKPVLALHENSE